MIFVFLPTGIKVIGGVKEMTGEEFGVYVKRILPGGLASSDGECRRSGQTFQISGVTEQVFLELPSLAWVVKH